MSTQIGLDMKLYYNTSNYASPSWSLISDVRDLTAPDVFKEADVSRRAAGFNQYEPTLRDFSIEFDSVYDYSDTAFAALLTRYAAKTLTEFALADGLIATNGTHYLRVECKLFKAERSEPLEGANVYSFMAKPCYSSNAPTFVTV